MCYGTVTHATVWAGVSAVIWRESAEAQRFLTIYHMSPIIIDSTAIGLRTRDIGWTTSMVVTTDSFMLRMWVPHMLKRRCFLKYKQDCIFALPSSSSTYELSMTGLPADMTFIIWRHVRSSSTVLTTVIIMYDTTRRVQSWSTILLTVI